MAVSGTMGIDTSTLYGGSSAITTQRGSGTWGANYTYSPSGLQNDVGLLADFVSLSVSGGVPTNASGVVSLGSASNPYNSGFLTATSDDGTVFNLIVGDDGLVSGVPV